MNINIPISKPCNVSSRSRVFSASLQLSCATCSLAYTLYADHWAVSFGMQTGVHIRACCLIDNRRRTRNMPRCANRAVKPTIPEVAEVSVQPAKGSLAVAVGAKVLHLSP